LWYFLHSALIPFLWWFQPVLDYYFHSHVESISIIFSFLVSFFYHTPPVHDLPLVWSVFHSFAALALGLYSTYEREHNSFWLSEPG
jgi:hypothetical protein